MKRQAAPLAVAALTILCLGGLLIEVKTNLIRRAYDDLVLDNRGHYLPCEKLPAEAEVRQALEAHPEALREIEAQPGECWIRDRRLNLSRQGRPADLVRIAPGPATGRDHH